MVTACRCGINHISRETNVELRVSIIAAVSLNRLWQLIMISMWMLFSDIALSGCFLLSKVQMLKLYLLHTKCIISRRKIRGTIYNHGIGRTCTLWFLVWKWPFFPPAYVVRRRLCFYFVCLFWPPPSPPPPLKKNCGFYFKKKPRCFGTFFCHQK